ncbi:TVG0358554 [Thermoplasma volcanium GSS1]|uniref:TVG0358554 protein n=1 Tax=Thermoplasma volcanium (strain ATCC 51530 / DSM 4299 / JCM 9571 / NBRC 15438 / GSS1) TaxID=273116 RepID=Q97BT7_THEVO|nr:helix-turn-helix domain-containing protein [Thermoplasma volcanium]BAB59510.1 TVG0358554 [Thermoplasma volcanium GSS1]
MRQNKNPVEALIEVERSDCWVTNLVLDRDKDAKIERLRIGELTTIHMVKPTMDRRALFNDLKKYPGIILKANLGGKDSIWVEGKSCASCRLLESFNIIVIGERSIGFDKVRYKIIAPSRNELNKAIRKLKEEDLNVIVLSISEYNKVELTPREKEIINAAFKLGYFDIDRQISMKDLAKNFGIKTASISDVMRRALKKIVMEYLEDSIS